MSDWAGPAFNVIIHLYLCLSRKASLRFYFIFILNLFFCGPHPERSSSVGLPSADRSPSSPSSDINIFQINLDRLHNAKTNRRRNVPVRSRDQKKPRLNEMKETNKQSIIISENRLASAIRLLILYIYLKLFSTCACCFCLTSEKKLAQNESLLSVQLGPSATDPQCRFTPLCTIMHASVRVQK